MGSGHELGSGKAAIILMAQKPLKERLQIKRSAMKEDLLFFAIPAFIVFYLGVRFCALDGLTGIWGTLWSLVKRPQDLGNYPLETVFGLGLFLLGLALLLAGQLTLGMNHSSSVLIRAEHKLITYGIYRFTRNPMYLGFIVVDIGLPLYASSLRGFLTLLLMIPLLLNRIRMEEKLLSQEFGDAFRDYKKSTRKLIPFFY